VTALSTVGAGHARGQAQVAGHVVICSGHGIVTVPVDASGTPVERQVLCPDCVVSLHAPPAAGPDAPGRRLAATRAHHPPEARAAPPLRPHGVPRARAPPAPA
jgi:hypothetical protein